MIRLYISLVFLAALGWLSACNDDDYGAISDAGHDTAMPVDATPTGD